MVKDAKIRRPCLLSPLPPHLPPFPRTVFFFLAEFALTFDYTGAAQHWEPECVSWAGAEDAALSAMGGRRTVILPVSFLATHPISVMHKVCGPREGVRLPLLSTTPGSQHRRGSSLHRSSPYSSHGNTKSSLSPQQSMMGASPLVLPPFPFLLPSLIPQLMPKSWFP